MVKYTLGAWTRLDWAPGRDLIAWATMLRAPVFTPNCAQQQGLIGVDICLRHLSTQHRGQLQHRLSRRQWVVVRRATVESVHVAVRPQNVHQVETKAAVRREGKRHMRWSPSRVPQGCTARRGSTWRGGVCASTASEVAAWGATALPPRLLPPPTAQMQIANQSGSARPRKVGDAPTTPELPACWRPTSHRPRGGETATGRWPAGSQS